MIQGIIIAVIFLAAIFYLGKMAHAALFVKKGCGSNCKCGVDFSNVDKTRSVAK